MYLGIEIGGTKLQFGVGSGHGEFAAFVRRDIDSRHGAGAILDEIERSATPLLQKHDITRVGFGFGGPVDSAAGIATKSHQVAGWDQFPLVAWCGETLGKPAVIGNDCDAAALAEATIGAGRGAGSVFYVTVGTGIGGGLVVGGKLFGAGRPAIAEIGHLRPGLPADQPEMTVESLAAGPGIAAAAVARMTNVSRPLDTLRPLTRRVSKGENTPARSASEGSEIHLLRAQVRQRLHDVKETEEEYIADLLQRAGGDADRLTAKHVAQAAADGNEIAREVLDHACQALGWAIGQVITLVAPEVVVVGGGVSLIGDTLFFAPLRTQVASYVFPPLATSYRLVPAGLGELAVVHGAIALARGD
ncbi:MAG: ROK family protein [Pirellulaceae bacterium]|nr:ROK family protein [Pirellulaceae bacterium]